MIFMTQKKTERVLHFQPFRLIQRNLAWVKLIALKVVLTNMKYITHSLLYLIKNSFLFIGRAILYNCKLSSDQRFLILDCHESVTSSPAITPTSDGDKSTNVCDQNGSEQHKKQLGINVIRPIDLSKITDAETHNAEKQGKMWLFLFIEKSGCRN